MIARLVPPRVSAALRGSAALLLLLLAVPALPAGAAPAAAPGDSALAVYDGGVVYPHDFARAWWTLSPPQRPKGSPLDSRKQFLASVVDRQLIAQQALAHPAPLSPDEEQAIAQARDQMIQNALFGELAKTVPDPTAEEVARFQKQRSYLAEIRFVTFKDQALARVWKSKLTLGTPLSKLDEALRREGAALGYADTFRFVLAEQIPDTLATIVWSLRPGGASNILDFAGQPTIVLVRSFLRRPNSNTGEDLTAKVELQKKRYERLRERVRQEMALRVKRTFDDANMQFLLEAHLKLRPRSDVDTVTGKPVIRPNLPLPQVAPEDTARVLARTTQTTVTIGQYLGYWAPVQPYARPEVRERASLDGAVDRVALAPALLEEATRRGLADAPMVRERVDNMREGYAVDRFYHDQFESKVQVTDAALRKFWAADTAHYNDPAWVEPRVIAVDRESFADSLIQRAREGASFEELAKEYSTVTDAATNGGLTGKAYKGTQSNAGLEAAMFATPVGQIGGPEKTPEGWVLWRIESADPGVARSFEDARWMVERDYRIVEADRLLTGYLENLKKQKHLVMHEERITPTLGKGGPWD